MLNRVTINFDCVVGVEFSIPANEDRKKVISEYFKDYPDSIENENFISITLPCCDSLEIKRKQDFPLEDVHCTCGKKTHYFIKYLEEK